jgi:hypothetical protein
LTPEPREDEREHRVFVNLVAAIALLALAIAGFWLLRFLDQSRKLQACLEAGRRDCAERFAPPERL